NPGNDGEDATRPGARRAVDEVETDLIPLAQNKDGTPQGAPNPAHDADFVGPTQRIVEDVAADDLQNKAQEHCQQQQRGNIFCPPAQPACACKHSGGGLAHHPRLRIKEKRSMPAAPSAGDWAGRWLNSVCRYFMALIFSIAPFGQSLAYLSRYFFCAKARK